MSATAPKGAQADRAFGLGCDLLKLFLLNGIPERLRATLTDKQRDGTYLFQCQVLARTAARAFANGWEKDEQYQANKREEDYAR